MVISAGTHQYCQVHNHVQVGDISSKVKNYAKLFSHNTFVGDRRGDNISRLVGWETLPPEFGE